MKIGVDASNIRSGGGVTHLEELLRVADPLRHGFDKVVVWASRSTLDRLIDCPWLEKRHEEVLEGNYQQRAVWQRNRLGTLLKDELCDLLFAPGGSFATDFRPVVTMSQNMLPFEVRELQRFGASVTTLRYLLLRWVQTRSYRKANGIIFLTSYAKDRISAIIGSLKNKPALIPHGINSRFFYAPREQRSIGEYSDKKPFRLIYVSIVNFYKHQWNLVHAVAMLRRSGFPISLDLIGPAYPPALKRLSNVMDREDPDRSFVHYLGAVPYDELQECYAEVDMCVFASSCENMPIILLEGMAAGLPIVCSEKAPMPQVLGDAGGYFDPESPSNIAKAIKSMLLSPDIRTRASRLAYERAQEYSWERSADETFKYLREVATGFKCMKR